MKYRAISGEGVRVSTLAIGGNIFGYACDQRQTKKILSAARDNGVNFVDTADVYSDGRSEEMIGNALSGQRECWIIASKVGVKSHETGESTGSKKVIFERIENSLRRLRTDYIDLYQLHHFDPDTPVQETLEAMEALLTQGKVRHFGLSNLNAQQVALYVKYARLSNLTLPATNQIHYNIIKREMANEHFAASESDRPRLLVYGALGRGVLSGKYRPGETPGESTRANLSVSVKSDLQPVVLRAVADLAKIGLEAGVTMGQLALAYVIRSPEVVSALVGIRTVEQLEEIVKGCALCLNVDFWAAVDDYLNNLEGLEQVSLGKPSL